MVFPFWSVLEDLISLAVIFISLDTPSKLKFKLISPYFLIVSSIFEAVLSVVMLVAILPPVIVSVSAFFMILISYLPLLVVLFIVIALLSFPVFLSIMLVL